MNPPESLDITPYRIVTDHDLMPPQSWFCGGDTFRSDVEEDIENDLYSPESLRCWQSVLAITDQNFIAYEWFFPAQFRPAFPASDHLAAGYFIVVDKSIVASIRTDLHFELRLVKRRAAYSQKDWLRTRRSWEEINRKGFQGIQRQWYAMQMLYREGDEYWSYMSGGDSWEKRAGRGGIALVRNQKIVASIIQVMN